MKSKKTLVMIFILVLALSATAFAQINVLRMGVIPFEELQLTQQKFGAVVRALEEVTGLPVEWYLPTSYASLIESQNRGFIDLAYYGPRSYVLANEVSNGLIQAFAMGIWSFGPYRNPKDGYESYLIVRSDSPYESVFDLEGKTLALVDPASTSGDLIPKVEVGQKVGKKINEYFGDIFYAGSHDAAALSVLEGRADVATVADITMDWAVDAGRYTVDDFRIIWRSSLMPMDPFAWRTDIPADVQEKIKEAFLYINEVEYGQVFLEESRLGQMILIDDSLYDSIRNLFGDLDEWDW